MSLKGKNSGIDLGKITIDDLYKKVHPEYDFLNYGKKFSKYVERQLNLCM